MRHTKCNSDTPQIERLSPFYTQKKTFFHQISPKSTKNPPQKASNNFTRTVRWGVRTEIWGIHTVTSEILEIVWNCKKLFGNCRKNYLIILKNITLIKKNIKR